MIVDVGSAVVKLQCPGDRLQNTPLKCFGTCVVIVFFNAADRKKITIWEKYELITKTVIFSLLLSAAVQVIIVSPGI